MKNDFRVDTTAPAEKKFIQKKQGLLGLALLLTVPYMFSAVYFPVRWLLDAENSVMHNAAMLAGNELYFLVMSIAGISIFRMMTSDKTFSKTLTQCTRLEGVLLAAASVVFPFLPGYQASGSTFFFSDMALLLPGVLLLILAELLKEAFEMQKEQTEIL